MLKWCTDVLLAVKQKITKVLIVYILMHEHISDNWYRDKSHVWWDNKMIVRANPITFTPVTVSAYAGGTHPDYNYGKDDKSVFFQDSIILGADPESFEKIDFPDGDSWTVFDRNRIYQGKDSPKLREYLKKKYGK